MANRYMLPVQPQQQSNLKTIYPWDNDTMALLCHSLYSKACVTGYAGTFEEFESSMGEFIQRTTSVTPYEGSYVVTPMANFDQILKTARSVLEEDIVVERIPIIKTSNAAEGWTAIIG